MRPEPAPSSPDRGRPTRRLVLQGGALSALGWALSGCTGSDSSPGPSSSSLRTGADPTAVAARADIRLVLAAIAGERAALAFCTSAGRRFPRHRDVLEPIAAEQSAHVAWLEGALIHVRAPSETTTPHVPHQVEQLTPALAKLESRLTVQRATDCLASASGDLAGYFGSMRACHAVRSALLTAADVKPATVPPPKAVRDVSALADCLAAEYAAVYGYGVIGGVLEAGVSEGPLALRAAAEYDEHQSRRDALLHLFDAARTRPPAAQPAYQMPFDVTGANSARRLARTIESRCTSVYVRGIAATVGDGRRFCSDVVTDCAENAIAWGAVPAAFPGLPDPPRRVG